MNNWEQNFYFDNNGACTCEISDGTGYVVAEVPIHVGSSREQGTRDKANLIAAAPDLLEALKSCHLQLLQSGCSHEYTQEACDMAYAALRKVEGK